MFDVDSLISKTIESIKMRGLENYTDTSFMDIVFTDGTEIVIEGYYADYTGESMEEYPASIVVEEKS